MSLVLLMLFWGNNFLSERGSSVTARGSAMYHTAVFKNRGPATAVFKDKSTEIKKSTW